MIIKQVKLYRPIMINGNNRETLSSRDLVISYNKDMNMVSVTDKKNEEILIPLTNIEHIIPDRTVIEVTEKPVRGRKQFDLS